MNNVPVDANRDVESLESDGDETSEGCIVGRARRLKVSGTPHRLKDER